MAPSASRFVRTCVSGGGSPLASQQFPALRKTVPTHLAERLGSGATVAEGIPLASAGMDRDSGDLLDRGF
ncbi:MAG: hypothetical protein ACP5XB_00820 [Isosphaeraceae bacterium]